MHFWNRYFPIVYGGMGFNHNRYVFFGLLLFTESMPQQVKESQSMDQQYQRKKKIPRPLSATIPLSKLFTMLASSLEDYLVSVWSGCHFIVTAFASILIGLFYFHDYRKKA
jgi:hypothetical protein